MWCMGVSRCSVAVYGELNMRADGGQSERVRHFVRNDIWKPWREENAILKWILGMQMWDEEYV